MNFSAAYTVGAGPHSIAAADLNGDMLRLSSLGLLRLSRMHKSTGKRRYPKRKPAGFLAHPLNGWLPSSMMPLGAIIFCELVMTPSSSIPPSRSR